MEVLFLVENQALLPFLPNSVIYFLDQLEFLCQGRKTPQSILPKISNCVIEGGDSLEEEIKHFWDLETLGIKHDEPTVYEKFIEDISHNEERYEVKLPFKEDHPLLPDNYHLSKMGLESLLRRLKWKPKVLKHYDEVVKEQLERNIIEPVHFTQQTEVGKVLYLPHRENIRLDKDTTKLHVVYEASAKHHGPNLTRLHLLSI